MKPEAVTIYLDTNVFLEFDWVGSFDWKSILEGEGIVDLVVATVVMKELEAQRIHPRSERRRKRARRALERLTPRFRGKESAELREGLTIRFDAVEPKAETFQEHDLRPEVKDDRLIATVLDRMGEDDAPPSIRIMAADGVLHLKALHHRIEALDPPEGSRIQLEESTDVDSQGHAPPLIDGHAPVTPRRVNG